MREPLGMGLLAGGHTFAVGVCTSGHHPPTCAHASLIPDFPPHPLYDLVSTLPFASYDYFITPSK